MVNNCRGKVQLNWLVIKLRHSPTGRSGRLLSLRSFCELRMDDLLTRVVEAIFTKSGAITTDLVVAANWWTFAEKAETSFSRLRKKILQSVETRGKRSRDAKHAFPKHGASSAEKERCSDHGSLEASQMNSGAAYDSQSQTTSKRQRSCSGSPAESEANQTENRKNCSTCGSDPKSDRNGKRQWISTLREMVDPRSENTSTDFLDLSQLCVQTKAITDDNVASSPYEIEGSYEQDSSNSTEVSLTHTSRKLRSRSFSLTDSVEDDEDDDEDNALEDEHRKTRTRRRRRRRRKSKGKNQVLYRCTECGSSFAIKWKGPASQFRCLFCDYWTPVEPEFMKDEKAAQNTCKIS